MLQFLAFLFVTIPLSLFYGITGPIRRTFTNTHARILGLIAGFHAARDTYRRLKKERAEKNSIKDDSKTE